MLANWLRLRRLSHAPRELDGTETIYAAADGTLKHMDPDGTVSDLVGEGVLPSPTSEGDVLTVVDGDWAGEAPSGGSQPFTPTDLTGLALWLDASTLTLDDDDPVALWPDASDNGFDAAQATADLKPVCKTAVMNGLRVVRFTSSPDVQNLALSGAALALFKDLDACTIAVAAGNCVGPGTNYVLNASVNGDDTLRRVGLEYHGDNVAVVSGCNDDSGSDADTAPFKISSASPRMTTVFIGTIDFAVGAVVSEASVPPVGAATCAFADTPGPLPNTNSDEILVGAFPDASSGSDCDYAEILVYQRALNATERRQILEYLSSKWATL